ncbi:hypothetical protein L484_010655 [Morus notabilis]|uniref:Uncharacterized protein n=1 Tax=Morus notabilis TaxID=981085 RepID=W9RZS4_9ROSA|nr:hypothetical protein L484_010655 [Morus notabilis]
MISLDYMGKPQSRKSMQKRQKQYFEQRKRQQQYQQQTVRLASSDDGMDTSAPHNKEHRSLDVISLLTLSTIAQECKSACPGSRKDAGVNASKMEFDITNHSPIILDTVVPANFVEFKETRTPSGFQVNTASQNKIASSVPDSHKNAVSGVNSKPDQWNTTAEQPLSVLDLLYDDGLSNNKEENIVHEAHVAFSVEGLGKVGTETPVHSPEQPNR